MKITIEDKGEITVLEGTIVSERKDVETIESENLSTGESRKIRTGKYTITLEIAFTNGPRD
tara:strand:+ start:390 stop:572 length:183 start_codon:yes stop_codon:yes gene_type:complete